VLFVEVHSGLFGKKILQDALSVCKVPRVELRKHENREQLSIAICEHAKQHKHDLKAPTALVA